ncbi:MAG: glycosyltransferase [Candidatus Neomarinimicrobiota bacterium]
MRIMIATAGHSPDDDRIYHRQVRSLLAAGHQVTLVTRGFDQLASPPPGLQHVDTGAMKVSDFARAMAGLAVEWSVDVLQVREFELLPAAAKVRQENGIPLVYDVGDHHREMYATFSTKPPGVKQLVNWGLLAFEKRYLKKVDRVTAASRLIEQRYHSWGAETTWVPNYPWLETAGRETTREPLAIYHGQISLERGLGTLISAFAGVARKSETVRLEIYGLERTPGLIEQLQTAARKTGLDRSIRIAPAIPHLEIKERLRQARIGVIPFHDQPLFRVAPPNKLYEYFQCGCAVVASDLPVLRQEGRDAVQFVAPGSVPALEETLLQLLSDDDRQRELTTRGRQLVDSEYNWEAVQANYLNVFEGLV